MKELFKKYEEIIRYLIVGGLTTVVSFGTYTLAATFFFDPKEAVQLQAANIVSWIASVTFAYFANRIFVFGSKNPHWVKEAASFGASRIGTLLIDMGLMFLGVTVLGWNDKLVKLGVQVVVTIGNYLLSKLIVFRKGNGQEMEQETAEGSAEKPAEVSAVTDYENP